MAVLIPPGSFAPSSVTPARGPAFTLPELQSLVGGYIEIVYLSPVDVMIVNEHGKLDGLPMNYHATMLARVVLAPDDYIVGPAVVCSRIEAGCTPEEPEEEPA